MKSPISLTQKSIKEDATASYSTLCAGQDTKGLMKKLLGCWLPSLIMLWNSSLTFMSNIQISLDPTLDHKMTKDTINFFVLLQEDNENTMPLLPTCFPPPPPPFCPPLGYFCCYPTPHLFWPSLLPSACLPNHHFFCLHIRNSLRTLWQILSIYLLRLEVDQVFKD